MGKQKNVLYLSNIEVPYRVRFFNALAEHCNLTVLYESRGTQKRNAQWAKSEKKNYRTVYWGADLRKVFRQRYDVILIGCYQTPLQILSNLLLRLCKIPFIINLDGEPFLEGENWRAKCKRFLLSGGTAYLVAGEKSADSLKAVAGKAPVVPYYFSSLSKEELTAHRMAVHSEKNTVLVVGQYFPYKGMDVALEAAGMDRNHHYRFIGMGKRTEKFLREQRIPSNVEVIPFLSKAELEQAYRECALLVLPSRRECWGLVVPEAASFGTPIVSTWGSGAAMEFLADAYPQYLASSGDPQDLFRCIARFFASGETEQYREYLLQKSESYDIERSVRIHVELLERMGAWYL